MDAEATVPVKLLDLGRYCRPWRRSSGWIPGHLIHSRPRLCDLTPFAVGRYIVHALKDLCIYKVDCCCKQNCNDFIFRIIILHNEFIGIAILKI